MRSKFLPWLIALSALSVSCSAAFYSVSGLGKMFAGAATQVMVLAGSLEFAKIVTASLLYQYWHQLNTFLKTYLCIATFILILITSAGIYGFLSSAYQETAFKVQNQDKSIEILDKDIVMIKSEISNYNVRIVQKNSRILQLTSIRINLQSTQDILIEKSKSTVSVRKQILDLETEIKRIDLENTSMNDSIFFKNLKIAGIERNKGEILSNSGLAKEIGPLKYIANLSGKSLEQVVNWFIIVLMLVFDPLAIALVIAANFAFNQFKIQEVNTKNNMKEPKITIIKKLCKFIKEFLNKLKFKKPQDKKLSHIEVKEDLDMDSLKEEYNLESSIEKIKDKSLINIHEDKLDSNNSFSEIAEEQENKIGEKDKYKNNILSVEKQKMFRERFRNNPGSNPNKSR